MSPRSIGCFTDVPVGYGSPQIQYLLGSLSQHFGNQSPVFVCQPRSDAFPNVDAQFPELTFHGIEYPEATTPFWFADAGRGQQRMESGFNDWLDAHRPDILILTGFNALRYLNPATAFQAWRPFVIHYALEFLSTREMDPAVADRHRASVQGVDLLLFTESNRRTYYNREFGTTHIPQATVLNVPPLGLFPSRPANERNDRVLVQSASIQWELTYPEYLATAQRPAIPVDVYGLIYSGAARVLDAPDAASAFGVRYLGAITNQQLASVRCDYAYSFVAWAPRQFNTLFACPNKLFESIASGVPPISAPHPQCADVIRTFDCGILMRNWSFDAFCEALETARSLLGTRRYGELVRNCLHAHRTMLNWERQFTGITSMLPARVSRRQRHRRLMVVDATLREPSQPRWESFGELLRRATPAFEPVAVVSRALKAHVSGAARVHAVAPEGATALATAAFTHVLDREGIGPQDTVLHRLDPSSADAAAQLVASSVETGARCVVVVDAACTTPEAAGPLRRVLPTLANGRVEILAPDARTIERLRALSGAQRPLRSGASRADHIIPLEIATSTGSDADWPSFDTLRQALGMGQTQ